MGNLMNILQTPAAAPFVTYAQRVISGEAPPPNVAQTVGFRMTHVEPGRATIEFEAEPRHWNPMGGLHGGIICDIADAAMGMAYASTLAEGESFTTIELKINFVRPFKTGRLIAGGLRRQCGADARHGRLRCAGRERKADRAGVEHRHDPPRGERKGSVNMDTLVPFLNLLWLTGAVVSGAGLLFATRWP